jgi:hypothetical protein
MSVPESKTCTQCQQTKPLDAFYHRSGKPIAACKDCTKANRREYVKRNHEAVKADLRERHWADREVNNRRSKAYRDDHIEERRAHARAHYAANRDAILERHRRVYTQVRLAMQRGDLVSEPCLFCDDPEVEAHHHDYAKPLDVTWLCVTHHRLAHKIVS